MLVISFGLWGNEAERSYSALSSNETFNQTQCFYSLWSDNKTLPDESECKQLQPYWIFNELHPAAKSSFHMERMRINNRAAHFTFLYICCCLRPRSPGAEMFKVSVEERFPERFQVRRKVLLGLTLSQTAFCFQGYERVKDLMKSYKTTSSRGQISKYWAQKQPPANQSDISKCPTSRFNQENKCSHAVTERSLLFYNLTLIGLFLWDAGKLLEVWNMSCLVCFSSRKTSGNMIRDWHWVSVLRSVTLTHTSGITNVQEKSFLYHEI